MLSKKKLVPIIGITIFSFFIIQLCSQRAGWIKAEPYSNKALSTFSQSLMESNSKIMNEKVKNNENYSSAEKALINTHIQKTLKKAPLNDDALLQFSILNYDYNSLEGLQPALLAKARNARHRGALRYLLANYLNSNSLELAMVELDLLIRLDANNEQSYLTILDNVYNSPNGPSIVANILQTDRSWTTIYLNDLIDKSSSDNVLNLIQIIKSKSLKHPNESRVINLLGEYLNALISFEKYDTAYQLWTEIYTTVKNTDNLNIIFNSNFSKTDVAVPFNWRLYARNNVYLEQLENGGISIAFNGNERQIIARQYVKAPEDGGLNLTINGYIDESVSTEDYITHLACLESRKRIARYAIGDVMDSNDTVIQTDEAECSFFDIQIWAMPNEDNKKTSIVIKNYILQKATE